MNVVVVFSEEMAEAVAVVIKLRCCCDGGRMRLVEDGFEYRGRVDA